MKIRKILICAALVAALLVPSLVINADSSTIVNLGSDLLFDVITDKGLADTPTTLTSATKAFSNLSLESAGADYVALRVKTGAAAYTNPKNSDRSYIQFNGDYTASFHISATMLISTKGEITFVNSPSSKIPTIPANFDGYILFDISTVKCGKSGTGITGVTTQHLGDKIVSSYKDGETPYTFNNTTVAKKFQATFQTSTGAADTNVQVGGFAFVTLNNGKNKLSLTRTMLAGTAEALNKTYATDAAGYRAAFTDGYFTAGPTGDKGFAYRNTGMGNQDLSGADYIVVPVKTGSVAMPKFAINIYHNGNYMTYFDHVKLVSKDGTVTELAVQSNHQVLTIPANFEGYIVASMENAKAVWYTNGAYNKQALTRSADGKSFNKADGTKWCDLTKIVYFQVEIKVPAGEGSFLSFGKAFAVDVEKTPAAARVNVVPTAKTLTYTGNAQELVTAGAAAGGEMQYKLGAEGTYGTAIPTATNAGTYTVYYKAVGDANHTDAAEASVSVTIAKATPVVTRPTAKTGIIYDGENHVLINAGSTTGGTLMYRVYVNESSEWSTELPARSTPGYHTIEYKVVGDENYNDVEKDSLVANIGKATPAVTPPTAKDLTYTGEAQKLINAGSTTGGTLQYKLGDGEWGTTVPTATNAGTYTVYYKVKGDHRYNDVAEASITVTIDKADATATAPTANTLTYTGEAQALITAGTANGGTLEYSLDNSTWSTEIPTATDAGSYNVFFKVVGDVNHNDAFGGPVTVTIAKVAATVTAPTANTLTYNGSAQALVAAGTANGGAIQYKLGDGEWGTAIPTATNAGTYTVYYKVVGDANHNDAAQDSVSVTIAKADATATAPTAKTDLVYNGELQALINVGTVEDGTFMYSADGNTWTADIPGGTNAGTYTVQWKVVGDANHNDVAGGTLTVTIAKATPVVTPPTAKDLTYTGEEQELITEGSTTGGMLMYRLEDTAWHVDVPTATEAGTYTVYYRVTGDGNRYNDVAEVSITVTIAKANATVTAPEAVENLVADGTAKALITAGTANGGTIQYKLGDGEWGTEIPTATEAGTYTVYYKVVGDANHNDVQQASVSVTISAPAPTPTPTPEATPTPTPEVTTPAPEATTPPTANPETGAISVLALAAVAVISGGMIVLRKKRA